MIKRIVREKGILLYFVILCSFIIFSFTDIYLFTRTHILFSGRDMIFHFRRVAELSQSINHFHFLPAYSFNFFHGSAVMSMYPYLSIYPFSILIILTHSIIFSYYSFVLFVIFCLLLISFISSLKYSKSFLVSYVFSIIYGTSSSIIFEIFSNTDLGVLTSLSFLPLVIFGFIDIINNNKCYFKLTAGIVLMTFCQIPSAVIVILFIFVWSILYIYKCNGQFYLSLMKSLILSSLLTSIIWIPLLCISFTNKLYTVTPRHLVGTPLKLFLEHISLIPIITIFLSCLFIKTFNSIDKQMFTLSLCVLFISSKLMPWRLFNSLPIIDLLNNFQYTFRFLIIPQMILCYLFAKIFSNFIYNVRGRKSIILLLLIIVILLQCGTQSLIINKKINHNNNVNINNYKSFKIFSQNPRYDGYLIKKHSSIKYILNGFYDNSDYYPHSSLSEVYYCHNNIIRSNNNLFTIKHIGYNTFTFNNTRYLRKITLPFVKYNNENLKIYLDNRHTGYNVNSHKLLSIKNIASGKHILRFKYLSNKIINIVKCILVSIGLLWMIFVIYNKFKDKYNND